MSDNNWPVFNQTPTYVRDREGVIWTLSSGYSQWMATTIDGQGTETVVGINVLRNERGPLHILKFTSKALDQFPMLLGDKDVMEPTMLTATSERPKPSDPSQLQLSRALTVQKAYGQIELRVRAGTATPEETVMYLRKYGGLS